MWNAGLLFVDVIKEELAGEFVESEFGGACVESVELVGFDAPCLEGVTFDCVFVFIGEAVFPLFYPDLFPVEHHVVHLANSGHLDKILDIEELTQSDVLIKPNLIEQSQILFFLDSVLVNVLVLLFGLFCILVLLVEGIQPGDKLRSVLPVE